MADVGMVVGSGQGRGGGGGGAITAGVAAGVGTGAGIAAGVGVGAGNGAGVAAGVRVGVGAGVGVGPYAELTFDADGDVDRSTREAVARIEATDLLVFAHGWNSDRSTSTRLYDRFFAPFPNLVGSGVRLGYVGVVWPSIRFSDEPIPDFDPPGALAEAGLGSALTPATRRALGEFWPDRGAELDRIAELLEERPDSAAAFVEFGALVRELVGVDAVATPAALDVPAMFARDVLEVCRAFTDALAEAGATPRHDDVEGGARAGGVNSALGGGLRALWSGAKEVLRQATYYQMKKRAGVVGEHGLGPVLAELAHRRPALRIHLIGHSFGARVAAFSLRAVPDGSRYVKSLTLLQGAFSHYAFTDRLPHDGDRGGALRGLQRRVDGPVVACHSPYDTSLKLFYPLASRMAGDSAGLLGFDERWGAIGHDGVRAVPGTPRLSLDTVLRGGLPGAGCVSVDAGSVVRRGGAPSGAHSDICHEELARVVVAAGRMGR
ncbi:serine-threonine protein kinase [Streptomyces sp. NBC_00291]|uniref:serine-threonine protein kinase n=1 Tax=Streptomyces sp. NBC_00291 TaxID=2975704 RepID=UPI00225AB5E5|nr:serine-threonine protein kinase [Streptomyces sp. NBC_00291]MCX5156292.1 serine-threonine protein kinase [Streptomyces sp. NBC_00291]